MAVTGLNFAAQVDKFVRQTDQRMTAVFRESAQRVIAEMQTPVGAGGNMPIDTGFLRASLQVGVNTEPVPANRPNPGLPVGYSPNVASLAIAGAEIGDTIVASYSAVYAPHVEYGSGNRPPRRFVGSAAARWQAIVQKVTAELKSRISGQSAPPSP
jgi:hypothetical protein